MYTMHLSIVYIVVVILINIVFLPENNTLIMGPSQTLLLFLCLVVQKKFGSTFSIIRNFFPLYLELDTEYNVKLGQAKKKRENLRKLFFKDVKISIVCIS